MRRNLIDHGRSECKRCFLCPVHITLVDTTSTIKIIRSETLKIGNETSSKTRANSKSRDAVVKTIFVKMAAI